VPDGTGIPEFLGKPGASMTHPASGWQGGAEKKRKKVVFGLALRGLFGVSFDYNERMVLSGNRRTGVFLWPDRILKV